MNDQGYQGYISSAQDLGGLDAYFMAEEERILSVRQSSLHESGAAVRGVRQQAEEVSSRLRRLSSRASTLAARYGVNSERISAPRLSLEHFPSVLRDIETTLDGIDAAEAWLKRAHQQLEMAQHAPAVDQIMVPQYCPPQTPMNPERVAERTKRRGNPLIKWIIGGGVAFVGAMATITIVLWGG